MVIDSANAAMLRDIFDARDTDRLATFNVDALTLGALVERFGRDDAKWVRCNF